MYVDIYTSLSLHFNNVDTWPSGKVRCKDLLDPGSIPNSNVWCFGKKSFFLFACGLANQIFGFYVVWHGQTTCK